MYKTTYWGTNPQRHYNRDLGDLDISFTYKMSQKCSTFSSRQSHGPFSLPRKQLNLNPKYFLCEKSKAVFAFLAKHSLNYVS